MYTGKCNSTEAMSSYTDERRIRRIGFIGTGPMSRWFVPYLKKEGIEYLLTGRTSKLRPEEMITQVNIVTICVPISAGRGIIEQYGKFLKPGQALITLAGETTDTINTALENTSDGVEVMNVHTFWGPLAKNMEGKNVAITKTMRSGELCEEYEKRLFYKYGANVVYDSPEKHDLMMNIEQKLPTALSVAYANILRMYGKEYGIESSDIKSHSTLSSIYTILGMIRVHGQEHRTYAEILSSNKKGMEMLRKFRNELDRVIRLGERGDIKTLEHLMKENARYLGEEFLKEMLELSKEVDNILSKPRKLKLT